MRYDTGIAYDSPAIYDDGDRPNAVVIGNKDGVPIVLPYNGDCPGDPHDKRHMHVIGMKDDGAAIMARLSNICNGDVLVDGTNYPGLVVGMKDGKPIVHVHCEDCAECDICDPALPSSLILEITDTLHTKFGEPTTLCDTGGDAHAEWVGAICNLRYVCTGDETTCGTGTGSVWPDGSVYPWCFWRGEFDVETGLLYPDPFPVHYFVIFGYRLTSGGGHECQIMLYRNEFFPGETFFYFPCTPLTFLGGSALSRGGCSTTNCPSPFAASGLAEALTPAGGSNDKLTYSIYE